MLTMYFLKGEEVNCVVKGISKRMNHLFPLKPQFTMAGGHSTELSRLGNN